MFRRVTEYSVDPGKAHLSPRQRECLRWTEQGKSSRDIAIILGLSPRTVEEHIAEACRKLGVRTRMQAVLAADRRGLLKQSAEDGVSDEDRSW